MIASGINLKLVLMLGAALSSWRALVMPALENLAFLGAQHDVFPNP